MTKRPKPPADYDDNPPLDDDFFARAKPATETAELVRRVEAQLTEEERAYRKAISHIVAAHEAGVPIRQALRDAQDMLAAE